MNPKYQGPQHDKKPYLRVCYAGASCLMTEAGARDFLTETEDASEYAVYLVWRSQAEVDALPEFTGF